LQFLHVQPEIGSSRKYPYPPLKVFKLESPPPSGNSSLASYFPLENYAFETPSPLEFLVTFLRVGMDIFWNCAMLTLESLARYAYGSLQPLFSASILTRGR